jgi:hypothetical protein
MSDTAGYSDLVFGLFWLLGYQFSPRLADLGETRFWRLDPHADYGPPDGLARHRINPDRIVRHWDDLLRVAGSLKLGAVSASQLIRSLHGRAGAAGPDVPASPHALPVPPGRGVVGSRSPPTGAGPPHETSAEPRGRIVRRRASGAYAH